MINSCPTELLWGKAGVLKSVCVDIFPNRYSIHYPALKILTYCKAQHYLWLWVNGICIGAFNLYSCFFNSLHSLLLYIAAILAILFTLFLVWYTSNYVWLHFSHRPLHRDLLTYWSFCLYCYFIYLFIHVFNASWSHRNNIVSKCIFVYRLMKTELNLKYPSTNVALPTQNKSHCCYLPSALIT